MLVAPTLNYSLLSPMLIILGGALITVLIEAFVGLAHRAVIQLTITVGSISLSLLQLWGIRDKFSTKAAVGSVVIDKAGIFLQGTILILALIAVLLILGMDLYKEIMSESQLLENLKIHVDCINFYFQKREIKIYYSIRIGYICNEYL